MARTKRDEVQKKVFEILKKRAQASFEGDVSEKTVLAADLGFDSLDGVELMMEMEETFGVTITDEEAEKIKTAKDAVDAVMQAPEGPKTE